jgi:hypothetical protein
MKLVSSILIYITAILLYYRAQITSNISSLVLKPHQEQAHMSDNTTHDAPQNSTSDFFAGLPLVPPNDPSLEASEEMAVARAVRNSFLAVSKSEGVGAKVRRSIGVPQLKNFTPFLMLDHFTIPTGSGFPDHPHRLVAPVQTYQYLC